MTEAEDLARRIGTTGAQGQLQLLEEHRQQLLDQIATREEWIQANADILHIYTATRDELAARATVLAISYQLNPPEDVLEVLGPRPTSTGKALSGMLQ